jgi:magnesium-transporting ATPase (P-type)
MSTVDRAAPELGLSASTARQRLGDDGPNTLPAPRRPSPLLLLGRQLVHFFALMLWVAAVMAALAGMPQLSVAIVVVIVLNGAFAFVQEARATRAAEQLRHLLPLRVTVRRDGQPIDIDATEVVQGDVLVLDPGGRIPADAVVLEATALSIDTSTLTGESEPTPAEAGAALFAGTHVVEGDGLARVTATGPRTRLAAISRMTTAAGAPETPLSIELRHLIRTIARIAITVGVAFFGLSLLLGNAPSEGLVFGVGVVVALVPEGLLPTVTLSLAWAAEQMADRQVLVRNLDAVETLGSTTFVCTDKTGTLTKNEMTVVEVWTPEGSAVVAQPGYDPEAEVALIDADAQAMRALASTGVLCSDGRLAEVEGRWVPRGDPMEVAIDVLARRLGIDSDQLRGSATPTHRFPFDPHRRRMSVVVDGSLLVKGAPDSVLPICADADGGVAASVVAAFAERGLRVLAIATRSLAGPVGDRADEVEHDLCLLGLLALQDPPREDAGEAVAACRRAGVNLAMVTGDHPVTATAIAAQVGLRRPGAPVLVGAELPADDAVLGAMIDHDGTVIARVSPEDKLRIARALRERGHVVAMTGDGVNDGPALHVASIGIAMGRSGTDVAREAADLVLLDDHFASIVAGIELGRSAFLNIRRFLTYHLTSNVAELTPFVAWALSGGRIPLALSVLQVLAIDVGTDTFTAVGLGAEPPPANALDRPPVSGRLMNRSVLRRAFALQGPAEALVSMSAFFVTFVAAGWRPGAAFPEGRTLLCASGGAFAAVIAGQAANAFACRSATRPAWSVPRFANRVLLPAVGFALVVGGLTFAVPPFAHLLDQALPTAAGWAVVGSAPIVILSVDAVAKLHRRPGSGAVDDPGPDAAHGRDRVLDAWPGERRR